jgi:acetyl esterase/lipase
VLQRSGDQRVTGVSTVEYVAGGDERQRLEIFKPDAADDLRTAVLVLHGGAFVHGDRTAVHRRCERLAAQGLTALAVGYRLLDSAPWPAQLDDVRAALQWTGEHADELGVDAGRILLQGHSAGAQLALLAAGGDTATEVGAVIAYYPPSAVSPEPSAGEMPAQMLFGSTGQVEDAVAASPITHIDDRFPPTILIHGAADRLVAPIASLRLFETLTAAGVRSELHLVAGQTHEFDMTPRYADVATDFVMGFLKAEVLEAELAAQEVIGANPFASMPAPGAEPGPTRLRS